MPTSSIRKDCSGTGDLHAISSSITNIWLNSEGSSGLSLKESLNSAVNTPYLPCLKAYSPSFLHTRLKGRKASWHSSIPSSKAAWQRTSTWRITSPGSWKQGEQRCQEWLKKDASGPERHFPRQALKGKAQDCQSRSRQERTLRAQR